ncbi:MAG TPA: hypothetical protein PLZ51_06020, partial [Aggregatilineales bacterium]|nr:hypothetical protein [Aggregatilineales bacterium]
FFAVIRDKQGVLEEVTKSSIRYNPNDLYDKIVSRLFVTRLHKDKEYFVTFAKRGSTDRTKALNEALEVARRRAEDKWNVDTTAPIFIKSEESSKN